MPPSPKELRSFADELWIQLAPSVSVEDLGSKSKLPFKLVSARELLGYRLVDLTRIAISNFEEGSPTAALILARASFETTAVLMDVSRALENFLTSRSLEDVDDALMKALFASNIIEALPNPVNILTRVDRLNRRFSGARKLYDELCESAHPNYAGTFGAYGSVDMESRTLSFGQSPQYLAYALGAGMNALGVAIQAGTYYYENIGRHFAAFTNLCEELGFDESSSS